MKEMVVRGYREERAKKRSRTKPSRNRNDELVLVLMLMLTMGMIVQGATKMSVSTWKYDDAG